MLSGVTQPTCEVNNSNLGPTPYWKVGTCLLMPGSAESLRTDFLCPYSALFLCGRGATLLSQYLLLLLLLSLLFYFCVKISPVRPL